LYNHALESELACEVSETMKAVFVEGCREFKITTRRDFTQKKIIVWMQVHQVRFVSMRHLIEVVGVCRSAGILPCGAHGLSKIDLPISSEMPRFSESNHSIRHQKEQKTDVRSSSGLDKTVISYQNI
jgi:hypothetical protein